MKFLADMGISPRTVDFLIERGHDAIHLMAESLSRLSDSKILEKARRENRILLTHDLDFGELVAASGANLPSVITFRLRNMTSSSVNSYIDKVLDLSHNEFEKGIIISVTEGQIRTRHLPVQ